MISVQEALNAIENAALQKVEELQPFGAELLDSVLSRTITSPTDLPRFDASAMDGYAVRFGDAADFKLLEEELTAGHGAEIMLAPGEAVRIFTGATCPATADAVVMQEYTEISQGRLKVSPPIKTGQNIRRRGEELRKGQAVLPQGKKLNPSAIGLIASLGIAEVHVYQMPNVGILTTGDELTPPGKKLAPGKIYDSNTYMLEAFLKSQDVKRLRKWHVSDDFKGTETTIGQALDEHDILLISGGISVGDYDFVKEALIANGVTQIFHTVKQKPGKPLFFGQKDQKFVFGLPGNPASAMSNAYLYVLPLINRFKGVEPIHLERVEKFSASNFARKEGRAQFLKALLYQDEVTLLEGQGSGMLKSFAESNALVYVPEENKGIKKGDVVTVIKFNN